MGSSKGAVILAMVALYMVALELQDFHAIVVGLENPSIQDKPVHAARRTRSRRAK